MTCARNQLPCSRIPELFNASPGVAMSGGAADTALSSLAAAYGDTTDDEDSDIDIDIIGLKCYY